MRPIAPVRAAVLLASSFCAACGSAPGTSQNGVALLPPVALAKAASRETISSADPAGSSRARPDAAEIDYAQSSAAGLFRGRHAERSVLFVAIDQPGFGLCLRAPSRTGNGNDEALIVFPRRLKGGPMSQVDDDTVVYRRGADTQPCRSEAIQWIPVIR